MTFRALLLVVTSVMWYGRVVGVVKQMNQR